MSEVKVFFRHCPSCGRRFEIRLVSKKLVEEEKDFVDPSSTVLPTVLTDGMPAIVDTKEFQYAYRCKHCGHEWSEFHVKHHTQLKPDRFIGD
jgi:transcription elongation factor Elf1